MDLRASVSELPPRRSACLKIDQSANKKQRIYIKRRCRGHNLLSHHCKFYVTQRSPICGGTSLPRLRCEFSSLWQHEYQRPILSNNNKTVLPVVLYAGFSGNVIILQNSTFLLSLYYRIQINYNSG